METIFFHFSRQQSTAASGSSFFFNGNIFSQTFIPASENEFSVYWKQYFFYSKFFLLMENITEIWVNQILKTNHISASRHHFFRFFQIHFKVEAVLRYNKSTFFNIFYPAGTNQFSGYGNCIFWVRAILLLLEIISVIKRLW